MGCACCAEKHLTVKCSTQLKPLAVMTDNLTLSAQEALCCLGDFSLAAQKPQPLSLELIISTSAQGTATTICTHYQQ